jgi:hypothetical protein
MVILLRFAALVGKFVFLVKVSSRPSVRTFAYSD